MHTNQGWYRIYFSIYYYYVCIPCLTHAHLRRYKYEWCVCARAGHKTKIFLVGGESRPDTTLSSIRRDREKISRIVPSIFCALTETRAKDRRRVVKVPNKFPWSSNLMSRRRVYVWYYHVKHPDRSRCSYIVTRRQVLYTKSEKGKRRIYLFSEKPCRKMDNIFIVRARSWVILCKIGRARAFNQTLLFRLQNNNKTYKRSYFFDYEQTKISDLNAVTRTVPVVVGRYIVRGKSSRYYDRCIIIYFVALHNPAESAVAKNALVRVDSVISAHVANWSRVIKNATATDARKRVTRSDVDWLWKSRKYHGFRWPVARAGHQRQRVHIV